MSSSTVQLVVTGKCEFQALHQSLSKAFPHIEFLRPKLAAPFTSAPIVPPVPKGILLTIDKFTRSLLGALEENPSAMVVGVDDLELGNAEFPDQVTAAVSQSVSRVLHETYASAARRERMRNVLAERCSFHLLVPMVEAYFFADVDCLSTLPLQQKCAFDASTQDAEDFIVAHDAYTRHADSAHADDWCRGGASRARHPKRYLKFLLSSGSPGSFSYRETQEGAAALRALDWHVATANHHFTRFARALLNDIADYARSSAVEGTEPEQTSRSAHRLERVLRNLG